MGLQKRDRELKVDDRYPLFFDLLGRSCLPPSHRSGQWLVWQATFTQLQWRDRAGFSPDFPDAQSVKNNEAETTSRETLCQVLFRIFSFHDPSFEQFHATG